MSATNGVNIALARSISYLYILPNDNPIGLISISPSTQYVIVAEGSSLQVMLVRTQGAFYRRGVDNISSLGGLRCGITLNYDQTINQYDQFELIGTDAIIIFSQLCFAF